MYLDLHTHSSASDGQYTPSVLMELAKQLNLEVIALTDHDTVAGIREARQRATEIGQDFIAGIEISTRESEEIHILGLGIDEENEALLSATGKWMRERTDRGIVIADYLKSIGVEAEHAGVRERAGLGSVDRPHFAE